MVGVNDVGLKSIDGRCHEPWRRDGYGKIAAIKVLDCRHADDLVSVVGLPIRLWRDDQHLFTEAAIFVFKRHNAPRDATKNRRIRIGEHQDSHGASPAAEEDHFASFPATGAPRVNKVCLPFRPRRCKEKTQDGWWQPLKVL